MANELQFAGDYRLSQIVLYSSSDPIDLRPLMLELNLYESVHSPNMYGNLVIRDSANHKQNAPIIGQEELEFEISIPENETIDATKYRMRIYKVDNITETAEREQVYTLHFITKEAFKNTKSTVLTSFEGPSDVIFTRIMRDVIKTNKSLYIERTNTNFKLLGNNMRPYDFVRMVAKRSQSSQFESAGYLFYENHRGIHFRSWESLIRGGDRHRKIKEEYYVTPKGDNINVEEDMKKVNSYEILKVQDALAGHASGFFGSKHYNYNRINKSLSITDSNYIQKFNKRNTTEDRGYPFLPNNPEDATNKSYSDFADARIFVSSFDNALHTQSTTDERNYDNNSKIRQDRLHDVLDHEQMILRVSVPGNTNLAAGDLIKLNIPSYESIDTAADRVYDLYLSGRYIITEVVHSVNEVNYVTTFKCVRNDVLIPYPQTDESIEDRTNYVEPSKSSIDVLQTTVVDDTEN